MSLPNVFHLLFIALWTLFHILSYNLVLPCFVSQIVPALLIMAFYLVPVGFFCLCVLSNYCPFIVGFSFFCFVLHFLAFRHFRMLQSAISPRIPGLLKNGIRCTLIATKLSLLLGTLWGQQENVCVFANLCLYTYL